MFLPSSLGSSEEYLSIIKIVILFRITLTSGTGQHPVWVSRRIKKGTVSPVRRRAPTRSEQGVYDDERFRRLQSYAMLFTLNQFSTMTEQSRKFNVILWDQLSVIDIYISSMNNFY